MALVFFSNRRGYDARAHGGDDPPLPDARAKRTLRAPQRR